MIRLCSNSDTRALLLRQNDIAFTQQGCDFDEDSIDTKDPKAFVYKAAVGKFLCCKKKYGIDTPLLVADTVVSSGGILMRKPKDIDDARSMLEQQSGAKVTILTAMIYQSSTIYIQDLAATRYELAPFDQKDLQRYLQSGIWQGKAGGITVEGFCKRYIQNVTGLQSCAMGLQIQRLLPFLKD